MDHSPKYNIPQLKQKKRFKIRMRDSDLKIVEFLFKKNVQYNIYMCFTLICILALFSRLSVVCLLLSAPKGTSCFSSSKYSRSLARLKL